MRTALLVAASLAFVPSALAGGNVATKKLDYPDFWSVAGITHDMDANATAKAWDAKIEKRSDGTNVQVDKGPSVLYRDDGGIQLMIGEEDAAWIAKHEDAATSLLGQTCKAAGARLVFYKKTVPSYLTCKRYDKSNWLLDVTLMCTGGKVSMLTVVWYPLPPDQGPYNNDAHC
ncbi:MAG TPA: hypothetical protein VGM39_20290 [Kofleriaceae bacterium]|jgi:hypothetical protein